MLDGPGYEEHLSHHNNNYYVCCTTYTKIKFTSSDRKADNALKKMSSFLTND